MSRCPIPPASRRATSDQTGLAARAPRGSGWRLRLALFALGAGVVLAAAQDLGLSRSVTPGLIERYAGKFGAEARTRLRGWQEFVRTVPAERRLPGNELELLESVNALFNRLPFVTDQAHWGVEDYWATPAEALASNGADCEDFTIAKYFTLKELGMPIQRLRLTYVKAVQLNQAHMVLAYYAQPKAMPLILDNLIDEVKPASERPDLIPVYSFNDEDVLIVRPGQRDVSAGSASQIRLWRDLLDKLKKELLY